MKPRLPRTDTGLLWLGLLFFFWLSVWMLLPIQPNDYWWYVRLGQQILSEGHIPQTDSFTFTRTGQPMVYHSWLSAVIFAGLRQFGGDWLTVLMRVLSLGVFYFFVWLTCRQVGAGPRLSSLIVFIGAMVSSNNWAVRPQLFSYFIFGAMLWTVWRWQQDDHRWLWVLPVGMLLWVNIHGAFVVAFLLVGAAFVGGGGARKPLLAALILMAIASLLNPRGLNAWLYVVNLLLNPSVQGLISEWQPPTVLSWQGKLFFGWLLLMVPLAAYSPQKLKPTHWLWFLGFGWMALSSIRYVIWFITVLIPLTTYLLVPWAIQYGTQRRSMGIAWLNALLLTLMLTLPFALLPGLREQWWPEAPPVLAETTPVEVTDWLADRPELPGQLWSDMAFSSYLIYALPERLVWNDTRIELYPPEQWERYIALAEAAPTWPQIAAEENINLFMLHPQFEERLVQALSMSAEWCELFRADNVHLFGRRATLPTPECPLPEIHTSPETP